MPASPSGYETLPGGSLSPDTPNLAPPIQADYAQRRSVAKTWCAVHAQQLPWARTTHESPPPSGYLTLIPLSDSRLQPRDTRLTAAFLLVFACVVAGAVFVAVPRGVSVGEISVTTDRMSWNTTKSTYQLKLLARVPIFNPNFLSAYIEGDLHVLFYKTIAGSGKIKPVRLPPRAAPKVLEVAIDASDVPSDYILAILSQCSTFPEVLIFFLKGKLTARFMWQRQHLAGLDSHFMVNCSG
ncbi:hypothetical protein ACK3TF_005038 [Chlorella vulgaris]